MLDGEYFIFCNAVEDTENGHNILGVFDAIYGNEFPLRQHPFMASICFRARKALKNETINLTLELRKSKEILNRTDVPIEIISTKKGQYVPITFDLSQVIFPKPGQYTFLFLENGKVILQKAFFVLTNEEAIEQARK